MSFLNRFAPRLISVFLIPFVIFYISGFFVISAIWLSGSANAVEESPTPTPTPEELPTPTPEPEEGKISGYKWDDLDGDGVWDDGEPALNDWKIWLDGDDYVVTGDDEMGWPDGYYEFSDLESYDYTVCEESGGENWTQTYPNSEDDLPENADLYDGCEEDSEDEEFALYGYDVEIVEIDENSVSNLNFGNFKYGYISGHKYAEETGEPISGWRIYLIDSDGNRRRRTTNEEGYYQFRDLVPGTYTVCETTGEDEETGEDVCAVHPYQTYPDTFYTIEMKSGSEGLDNPNYDFKNYTQGVVKAFKFKDLNWSEGQDKGEPAIEGWDMCLYFWDNEIEDWNLIGDECKKTGSDGWAVWTDLDFGSYKLEEKDRVGWTHTNGNSDEFELDEDDVVYTRKFGNVPNELEIIKFYDTNSDDNQNDNEEVLSGWEFCLYRIIWGDGDPVYEPVSEDNCRQTGDDGSILWSELEAGDYLVDEEERPNWFHTDTGEDGRREVEVEEGRTTERFGNVRNAIRVLKFWDKDNYGERDGYWTEEENSQFIYTEPVLEGWEFCLYKWNLEIENWELVNCKDTDADGWVVWLDLEKGEYKVVETAKEDWFPTNFEGGVWEWVSIEDGEGEQIAYFGNDTTSIDVHKFYDINQNNEQDYWAEGLLEPDLRNWRICLYRVEDSEEIPLGCKLTDGDGLALWEGLTPGLYRVVEELRDSWIIPNGGLFGESPHIRTVKLEDWGDEATVSFGNWIEDENPPVSQFDQPRDHEVIDTEMVSLELTGRSYDRESGVKEADMTIYKLGGSESVQDYPAKSFFDVFNGLSCPPEGRPIETELIALSLVSVNPITVSWSRDWSPSSTGTYCFEVKSKDYADNPEQTAWAGPLAYVPVVQISDNEIIVGSLTETSFIAEWQTDKSATSRVIYDTVSHESLGEAPNYDYAFSTAEQDLDPKVTNHSVVVSGLTSGTTYYYRMISAASPESVSSENSTSTSSSQSSSGGSGGGGAPGLVFLNGPLALAFPVSAPAVSPASTGNQESGEGNVAGAVTGEGSSSSGQMSQISESVLPSSETTEPENEEPLSSEAPASENTGEISTAESSEAGNGLFASIGGLLNSVSLWWFLVIVIVATVVSYINRRKTRSKKT